MENIEIQKPITVRREEFKEQLINIINNSMLPAFVVESILADMLREASVAVRNQYEYDLKQYNETVKENEQENEE